MKQGILLFIVLLVTQALGSPSGSPGRGKKAELASGWGGRHPQEAAEVASILRRLKRRLEKDALEARAHGFVDFALESEEQVGQIGEMWKILEEVNGEKIVLETEEL
jgi:hypothetical protein